MRTIIIAPSMAAGIEVCNEVGARPWARETVIATPRNVTDRGFQLVEGDRVFEHVEVALSPECRKIVAFFKTLRVRAGNPAIEWKVSGSLPVSDR